MIKIERIEDVRLEPYLTLRARMKNKNLENLGVISHDDIFVAESEKVVKALLQSSLPVVSILALPHYYDALNDVIANKRIPSSATYVADEQIMMDIVGYRMHQGIMAIGQRPQSSSLQELTGPIVALNGICNAENVGAIVRCCAAFDIGALIVDKACSPPFLRRSIRVSMGTIFSMHVHTTNDLVETLTALKYDRGYTVLGAHLHGNVVDIINYRFPEKYVLVLGTEGTGLEERVVNVCDALVKVPISACVESLNVAAATAVILHVASKL